MKTKIDHIEFAKSLAYSDDKEQAEFLNAFANELSVYCRDRELTGLQPCAISDKLNDKGILLVKSLTEFVGLRGK